MIVCIFTNSISELCLHLTSQFCALLGSLKVSFMREEIFFNTQESGSSPALILLWLCATGVAALCCIIKSHIHAPSFSFFLSCLSLSVEITDRNINDRGQRGKKWRVLCVQETPCPID